MKNKVKLTLSIIVMIFTSITINAQKIKKVSVGDNAYNIVGTDQNGNKINLYNYRGKYILLNFTATNCGPCWKTYNIMNEVQEKYSNKLKVISFHFDNNIEKWNAIAQKKNIDFKCTSIWESKDKSNIISAYKIDGYPYFYLIDKKGKIVKKWFGNQRSKIEKMLKKI